MIKVLILVENFKVGGAQYMVYELIKNLDPSTVNCKVICYTKRRGTDLEKMAEQYAEIEYLNISGHVGPLKYMKVLRAINKFKPDVVHAHLSAQIFSIGWGLLYRKPTLITAHALSAKAFIKKTEGFLKFGLKHGKHYIAAVSDNNCDGVKKYFKISGDRCFTVNNGIDIDAFPRREHEHFTFINVATHNENKNQMGILRCFARLASERDDIRLSLVGDGPLHEQIMQTAKELGIEEKVAFPGSVSDVDNYYAVADAYIQASHREAMPLSVLEAMAASLPIIATNVGGLSDVVKENGFLIDDDEEELFDAMKKMLELPKDEREKMESVSKEIVQAYSSSAMARKYTEIYEKIC